MITFQSRSLIENLKYKLIPSYRRKCNAETRAAIKWLCDHPEAPCIIGGHYIPDGYCGQSNKPFDFLGF